MAIGQLIAAGTCGEEPAKSIAISSPATVTVAAMAIGRGSSPMPSM